MTISILYAQKDLLPGYIITPEFDTIRGELADRHPSQNALECRFKAAGSDNFQVYKPGDLHAYRYTGGRYYVSRSIGADEQQHMVFLEYLVKGALDILYYQDRDLQDHYIAETEREALTELLYTETLYERDGAYMMQKTNTHRLQLEAFTADQPSLKPQIEKIEKPEHQNLISLARNYNKAVRGKDNQPEFIKKKPFQILLHAYGGGISYVNDYDLVAGTGFMMNGGMDLLFQQGYLNEFFYVGIGVTYITSNAENGVPYIGLPLSMNYLRNRQGLSPLFRYEIDLGSPMFHAIKAGIRYKTGRISFQLLGELRNELLSFYAYGASLGMMVDLR